MKFTSELQKYIILLILIDKNDKNDNIRWNITEISFELNEKKTTLI